MKVLKSISNDHVKKIQSLLTLIVATFLAFNYINVSYAQMRLPGEDITGELQALGTIMKLADTLIFKIVSRVLSGLAILAAAWNLKEQRIGMCVLSAFAAVFLGLTPMFVKNIFDVGGGTIFSMIITHGQYYV